MSEAILLQIPHVTEITVNPFQISGPIEYAYPEVDKFIRKTIEHQEEESTITTKSLFQISGSDIQLANIDRWALIIWGLNPLSEFEKKTILNSINAEYFTKSNVKTDSELILAMILTEVSKYEGDESFCAHVLRNSVKTVLNRINMPANITKATFVINNGNITFAYSGLEPAYFGILELQAQLKIVPPKSSTRIYTKHNPLRGIVVSSFDTVAGKKVTRMDSGKVLMVEKDFTLQIEDF